MPDTIRVRASVSGLFGVVLTRYCSMLWSPMRVVLSSNRESGSRQAGEQATVSPYSRRKRRQVHLGAACTVKLPRFRPADSRPFLGWAQPAPASVVTGLPGSYDPAIEACLNKSTVRLGCSSSPGDHPMAVNPGGVVAA